MHPYLSSLPETPGSSLYTYKNQPILIACWLPYMYSCILLWPFIVKSLWNFFWCVSIRYIRFYIHNTDLPLGLSRRPAVLDWPSPSSYFSLKKDPVIARQSGSYSNIMKDFSPWLVSNKADLNHLVYLSNPILILSNNQARIWQNNTMHSLPSRYAQVSI